MMIISKIWSIRSQLHVVGTRYSISYLQYEARNLSHPVNLPDAETFRLSEWTLVNIWRTAKWDHVQVRSLPGTFGLS